MRRLNLVGQRFGKLLVLRNSDKVKKYLPNTTERFVWCRCDCGSPEKEVSIWLLRSGHTSSCGCFKRDKQRKFRSPEEAAIRLLLKSYISNAKKRKIPWELSLSEFWNLVKNPCWYCKEEPPERHTWKNHKKKTITKEWRESVRVNAHGVDRVDNQQGYHLDNCVSCCKRCNLMKHDMSKIEFLMHVHQIARTHHDMR